MSLVAWYKLDESKIYNEAQTGDWNISTYNVGYNFEFPGIPEVIQDTIYLRIQQNDLEGSIDIKINDVLVVDGVNGTDATTEWNEWLVPSAALNTDRNIVRIYHNGGSADWGHIYDVNLYSNTEYTEDSSGNRYDGSIINTPTSIEGKINNAYTFNYNTTDGINIPSTFDLFDFTISAWINIVGNHLHYDGTIISSGNWNSTHWSFGIKQDNTGFSCRNPFISQSYTFLLNTWYHVVYKRKETLLTLYVNGEQVYEEINSANIPLATDSLNTTIGRETYSNGYFGFNGSIDDVKIYDHALSLKEVKELAKAKVLHYNFDDMQEPTENLYRRTSLIPGGTAPYTISVSGSVISGFTDPFGGNEAVMADWTSASNSLFRYGRSDGTNAEITTGIEYTFSVWAKLVSISYSPTNFSLDVGDSGSTDFSLNLSYTWQRFSITVIPNISANYGFADFAISVGSKIYLAFPQIEQKDHATPFTETERTGEVNDSSGYNNDAELILATTPKWAESSKLGNGAYDFTKELEQRIQLPELQLYDKTISFWTKIKPGEHTSAEAVPFLVYNDGVIASSGDTNQILLCMQNNSFRMHGWSSGDPICSTNINDGQWHHLVWSMTYHATDTAQRKMNMWIDGNQEVTNYNYDQGNDMAPVANSYWWIGYNARSYSSYLRASSIYMDNIRFYSEVLSDDDVKELYQTRASLDNKGNLNLVNLNEYSNWDETINNDNLLENGCQEYESNYNNTSFIYNSSLNCLSKTSGSSTTSSTNYIPIKGNGQDLFDSYILEGYVKGVDYASRFYYMLICYDKYFQRISNEMVNARSGTATTITQDLVYGDTEVHLADLTNWYDDGTTVYSHMKTLAMWCEGDDLLYTPLKYTRRIALVNSVDKINNILTLRYTYTGTTVLAGSIAQNHQSGGTYSYIAASNSLTNLVDWDFKISAPTPTSASTGAIRYGTSFVRTGFLINRYAEGGTPTTLVKNMKFYNVSNAQNLISPLNKPILKENGVYSINTLSEVSITKGLTAWYPLNGDAEDYVNNNNGTVGGAIIATGLNQLCYDFNGSTDYISGVTTPTPTTPYTLLLWAKPDVALSTSRKNIIVGPGPNWNPGIWADSNLLRVHAATEYRDYTISWSDLSWHMVGQIFDGTTAYTIWDDNIVLGSRTAYSPGTQTQLYIAAANTTGESYNWNGKIQNVKIFDRVLTSKEIKIEYDINKNNKMKISKDNLYIVGEFQEN